MTYSHLSKQELVELLNIRDRDLEKLTKSKAQIQAQLQDQLQFQDKLISFCPIPYFEIDETRDPSEPIVKRVNKAFADLFELDSELSSGNQNISLKQFLDLMAQEYSLDFEEITINNGSETFSSTLPRINRKNDLEYHQTYFSSSKSSGVGKGIIGFIVDNLEVRRAQEEAKAHFRRFFETGLVGMTITDSDKNWIAFNDEFCRMLGYSREEVADRTWVDLSAESNLKEDFVQFERLINGEIDDYKLEKEFIHKKGSLIRTRISVTCFRNRDNKVERIFCVYQDLTELKNSKDNFQKLAEATFEGILLHEGGIIEEVNQRFLDITGYSRREVIGAKLVEFVIPDHIPLITRSIEVYHRPIPIQVKTLNRGIVEVEVQAKRVVLGKNKKTRIVAIRDISARVKAEAELDKERNMLRSIINNIPDRIYIKDKESRFIEINKAHAEILMGIAPSIVSDPKQIRGKTDHDIYPKTMADQYLDTEREVMEKDKMIQLLEDGLDKHGNMVQISTVKVPYKDGNGNIIGIVGIGHDVSVLKKVEQDLQKANAIKRNFLANMSHEIKTPLTAIMGYSDLLTRTESLLEVRDYARSIYYNTTTLLEFVDDTLDMAKIDGGKLIINNLPTDLRQICKEVSYLFSLKLKDKILFYNHNIATALPPFIELDKVRIKQLLINLIGNAIKYTNEGGSVKLIIEAKISEKDPTELRLEISVEDTGIGISEEDLELLFEPFDRAKHDKAEGTGLGLSISKGIVSAMGGEIFVKSKLKEGTIFKCIFPTIKISSTQVETHSRLSDYFDDKTIRFHPQTIFIVDNSTDFRDLVEDFFKGTGINCIPMQGGQEAIEAASRIAPDLILMDIRMPEMTGIEATRKIRDIEDLQEVPILAITADKGFNIDVSDNLFDEIFFKPITRDQLLLGLLKYIKYTEIRPPLNQYLDIYGLVSRIKRESLTPSEWEKVMQSLTAAYKYWEEIEGENNLNKFEEFGNMIVVVGERFGLSPITEFGEQVRRSAQNCSVDKLRSSINAFPDFFYRIQTLSL
ncbi:MAG: PAS domain S-box protein [Bacteroidota bacterium]